MANQKYQLLEQKLSAQQKQLVALQSAASASPAAAAAAGAGNKGGAAPAVVVSDDIEALHGVNNREQLSRAERYAQQHANRALMLAGVTLLDPATTYIEHDCVVEQDAVQSLCSTIARARPSASRTMRP